ncbi:hypothetical protein M427DRAFT_50190 [Gonapodya prolifera JEL478]|uniref:Uncharacterized protein n=1 Tax=Gonapodya prolifera (strain JEL478) TaxID=1344416 RepID=A0A138ZWP5_GONPJ|nr:hypothetical protein M427DRAFT_50190 [Gonapodya prolifera JEL478]|eukprot:KXS08929.1 hypothetical protein M427DRAFT_50190 [Gonapodya prolifera JEL478]
MKRSSPAIGMLSPDADAGRASSASDANNEPSTRTRNSNERSLSLRTLIVLLVTVSISSVAVVTVWLGVNTNNKSIASSSDQASQSIASLGQARLSDASDKVLTAVDSYLNQVFFAGISFTEAFENGLLNYTDYDAIIPFLNKTIAAFKLDCPNTFALVSNEIYGGTGPPAFLVRGANLTCQRFCPVNDTQGANYVYPRNPATLQIGNISFSFNFPPAPEYFILYPKGTAHLSDLNVGIGNSFYQEMYTSILAPSGQHVAAGAITFTVRTLCSLLDTIQTTLTNNSLLYMFVPTQGGRMVAISGLGNDTMQRKALILNSAPRSIFDFSYEEYPLLNISAATIFQYSGNNFSRELKDSQWMIGDYMFQFKSLTKFGFKYYLVTGASQFSLQTTL